MPKPLDLTGKRFGKLITVEPTEKRTKNGAVIWRCRCDCGNDAEVAGTLLARGLVSSCGCLQKAIPRSTQAMVDDNAKYKVNGTNIRMILPKKASAKSTTGVLGVNRKGNKYAAQICFKNKRMYLGTFDTIEEATVARKKAEEELYGEEIKRFAEEHPEAWNEFQQKREV